jgi:hypothetical protein
MPHVPTTPRSRVWSGPASKTPGVAVKSKLPTLLGSLEKAFNSTFKADDAAKQMSVQSMALCLASDLEDVGVEISQSWDLTPGAEFRLSIGKTAVQEHIEDLDSSDMSSRYHAAENLASLGPKAIGAVPSLLKTLSCDSNGLVRKSAALALGEIGCSSAVSDLQRCALSDDDKFVRQRALQALKVLGFEAPTAGRDRP